MQSHYEINVSVNGKHLFATNERSFCDMTPKGERAALECAARLRAAMPDAIVDVLRVNVTGYTIENGRATCERCGARGPTMQGKGSDEGILLCASCQHEADEDADVCRGCGRCVAGCAGECGRCFPANDTKARTKRARAFATKSR